MDQKKLKGLVFDVQRFSIHDGPGIRTTVFMKGCPATCKWCQNPESQSFKPQIIFTPTRCIGCGACMKACPENAIWLDSENIKHIDRVKCTVCGKCVEVCYAEAMECVGRYITVDELVEEVERDKPFFDKSGGGVTVSGGEPMAQADFVSQFLKKCKQRGMHTCIDTMGFCDWKSFQKVLPYADMFLYDLKQINPEKHIKSVGLPNDIILENLKHLAKAGKEILIRVPVIPGHNASREDIAAICRTARELCRADRISLLPYHALGKSKFKMLDMEYELEHASPIDREEIQHLKELCESEGLKVLEG